MSQSNIDNFNLFEGMSDEEIERFLLDSANAEQTYDDDLFVLDDSNNHDDIVNNIEENSQSLDEYSLFKNAPNTTDSEPQPSTAIADTHILSTDISDNSDNIATSNSPNHLNEIPSDISDDVFKLDEQLLSDAKGTSGTPPSVQHITDDPITNDPHLTKKLKPNASAASELGEAATLDTGKGEDTFDELSKDYIFDDLPIDEVIVDDLPTHEVTVDELPNDNLPNDGLGLPETSASNSLTPNALTSDSSISKDVNTAVSSEHTANASAFDTKAAEINQHMEEFLQKMQEIARQSDEFHEISSRLIEAMRLLQLQESEDDFSITYEQIYQLRGCMLVARRAFNEIPNFYDMVEQAWENDLYTAQMRQQKKNQK